MSSEKQIEANKKNALLSTGPISENGKKTVSLNSVKHGIFSKDLIIGSGLGKEAKEEYEELHSNLLDSFNPSNQIEMLLVEKISIDFWRLRRVIRFESGCIRKFIQDTLKVFYSSWERKSSQEIENEIEQKKRLLEWNTQYIKCLEEGEVNFDEPVWKGNDIESDIIEDFYDIARNIDHRKKTTEESNRLYQGEYSFEEIKKFILGHGFATEKEISTRLLDLLNIKNERIKKEIHELERKKEKNQNDDCLNAEICAIPDSESVDKIMKYETSIQRSIYQNLFLLKKLQEAA
jgi:hypothetical protein